VERKVLLSSVVLVLSPFLSGGLLVAARDGSTVHLPVVQRFLSTDDSSPSRFRAHRHLEAKTAHLGMAAWMDVDTEGTPDGFRYTIVDEGGSDYIRSHVFKSSLDTERRMWATDSSNRAVTPENYVFDDRGLASGLAEVRVTPRRKEVFLLDGSIFLRPEDGDLVRVEGTLTKNPSFWTRHVQVVGHYERIAGVRLPVAFESTASIVVAGTCSFTMTYNYEMVNGQDVSRRN
jgi:hypothetical protein